MVHDHVTRCAHIVNFLRVYTMSRDVLTLSDVSIVYPICWPRLQSVRKVCFLHGFISSMVCKVPEVDHWWPVWSQTRPYHALEVQAQKAVPPQLDRAEEQSPA